MPECAFKQKAMRKTRQEAELETDLEPMSFAHCEEASHVEGEGTKRRSRRKKRERDS